MKQEGQVQADVKENIFLKIIVQAQIHDSGPWWAPVWGTTALALDESAWLGRLPAQRCCTCLPAPFSLFSLLKKKKKDVIPLSDNFLWSSAHFNPADCCEEHFLASPAHQRPLPPEGHGGKS